MKNLKLWAVEWISKKGTKRGQATTELFERKQDAEARMKQLGRGGFQRTLTRGKQP